MTQSFGNTHLTALAAAPRAETFAPAAVTNVAATERRTYRKPALKRLGLLRSVTGSDLKW